jgi:hypothetical protein
MRFAPVYVLILLVGITGCATSQEALSPAQDALAATSTAELAFEQYAEESTLPTVTVTTLEDMLAAVSESESTIVEIPARTDSTTRALGAVRASADAIAGALFLVQSGDGVATDAAASLAAASDGLDAVVTELQGSK